MGKECSCCCSKCCIFFWGKCAGILFSILVAVGFYLYTDSAPINCYHCSYPKNDENGPPFENNCLDDPKNQIQCDTGEYCGFRYQAVDEENVRHIERFCGKDDGIKLKRGQFTCDQKLTTMRMQELSCWCNIDSCMMK